MRFWTSCFFIVGILVSVTAWADNTVDDMFTVNALSAGQATLSGKVNTLKPGDYIYFIRSPFRFKISAVTASTVTIELPQASDVVVGNTMVRRPTPTIEKALDTESKLKSALSD